MIFKNSFVSLASTEKFSSHGAGGVKMKKKLNTNGDDSSLFLFKTGDEFQLFTKIPWICQFGIKILIIFISMEMTFQSIFPIMAMKF